MRRGSSAGHAYVDTKVASEQIVLQAHAAGEIDVTVIRPGDVYGPGSRPWTIIPVEGIRAGKFLLPSKGTGVFSPVYVDNLVDGVVLAAEHANGVGQVFNLSDGRGVTNADFFGHYYRMLDRRPLTTPHRWRGGCSPPRGSWIVDEVVPPKPRPRPWTTSCAPGPTRSPAERLLGYRPAIDLFDGMNRTEAWLGDHGYL